MNSIFLPAIALSLTLGTSAFGASYVVDPAHSQIGFRVKHLFSQLPGRFQTYSGSFDYDKDITKTGNFVAEIDAASVNTDQVKRDEHLKSPDFFDAAKFAKITFKSTKVTPKAGNNFVVAGDLTIRGVTKPVELAAEYLGEVKDPTGTVKAGLRLTGKINRKDFGITWNKTLDGGSFVIGEQVDLDILLEAGQVDAKKKA